MPPRPQTGVGLRRYEPGGPAKLSAEDFSVSLRQSAPRLDVKDESKIPAFFLIPQPPRVDRAGILTALKRGEQISGAVLEEASFHIQVRTR